MFNPPVIAVVDDEEAIRDALSDLLLVMGYTCHVFDRAETFLAADTPDRFDCLITDIRMPGISGLELLQRLKAQGSTMPVTPIPQGYHSVTPYLIVKGAAAANQVDEASFGASDTPSRAVFNASSFLTASSSEKDNQ